MDEQTKVGVTGYSVQGYKHNAFEALVGTIMQSIEIVGLESRQENALKSNIKDAIWTMWDNPQFCYSYEPVQDGEDKLII